MLGQPFLHIARGGGIQIVVLGKMKNPIAALSNITDNIYKWRGEIRCGISSQNLSPFHISINSNAMVLTPETEI